MRKGRSWADKMDIELEAYVEDADFMKELVAIVRKHLPKRRLSDVEDRALAENMSMLGVYIAHEVGYTIRHEWEVE